MKCSVMQTELISIILGRRKVPNNDEGEYLQDAIRTKELALG